MSVLSTAWDHAMGACGAEHPQESRASGFAWLFLGDLGASQRASKKVCFILGAAAVWLSPAPGSEAALCKAGGEAGAGSWLRVPLLTPSPPRRWLRLCQARSCLNTSSKVLSCGFVIPVLPFHLALGGGQIAICCGLRGAGGCRTSHFSPPCPTEQPWR